RTEGFRPAPNGAVNRRSVAEPIEPRVYPWVSILYFHGPAEPPPAGDNYFDTGTQKTLAATSSSGLNFNLPTGTPNVSGGVGGGESGHGLKNAVLGNAYFRTFEYDGNVYAFSNYGPIWKAPNAATPWETTNTTADAWTEGPVDTNPVYVDLAARYDLSPGGQPPRHYAGYTGDYGTKDMPRKGGPRHFATLLQDDGKTLEVWYTCRGDKPERIFRTTMDLSQGTWETWDTAVSDTDTVHQEMLRPELDWEGADQPLDFSKNGSETDENQLRDPYLFCDADGQIYLFYSGEGEEAIGIARVHPRDTDGDGMSDDDESVAGTDSADSNSVFRVEASFSTDPDSVCWFSASGRTYQLDYSTNLISWIPLHQDIAASPPTNQHSIASAPGENSTFFRLQVCQ
ncbi:hypothetical protein P4E94_00940, partial [Pontiellaceae bacterium B12219]|nr:hypothetical protein [Pontiellaceae bacterium B12219]